MLYHLDEWQSTGTKIWYCEHTSSYPQGVQKWVIPARVLNMSVDDFLRMLIKDFKPDVITVKKMVRLFHGVGQNNLRCENLKIL